MSFTIKDWANALRSGEYKQGNGWLYNQTNNAFCCLGVFCNMYNPDLWSLKENNAYSYYFDSEDYGTLMPPSAIRHKIDVAAKAKWATFIPEEYTKITDVSVFEEPSLFLAHLNDEGRTFEEIADVIELIFNVNAVIE